MESKACNICGEIKELKKFPKYLQRDGETHGWRNTCKSCINKKYNNPTVRKQKKLENSSKNVIELEKPLVQDKLEFTEEEIFQLKSFINGYEKHIQKKKLEEKTKGKTSILLEVDIIVSQILDQCSNNSGIDKSSIVNALLIKEFIKDTQST